MLFVAQGLERATLSTASASVSSQSSMLHRCPSSAHREPPFVEVNSEGGPLRRVLVSREVLMVHTVLGRSLKGTALGRDPKVEEHVFFLDHAPTISMPGNCHSLHYLGVIPRPAVPPPLPLSWKQRHHQRWYLPLPWALLAPSLLLSPPEFSFWTPQRGLVGTNGHGPISSSRPYPGTRVLSSLFSSRLSVANSHAQSPVATARIPSRCMPAFGASRTWE